MLLQKLYYILQDKKKVAKLSLSIIAIFLLVAIAYAALFPKSPEVTQEGTEVNVEEYFSDVDRRSDYERFLDEIEKGEEPTYYNPRTKIIKGGAEPFRFYAKEKEELKKEEVPQSIPEKKQVAQAKNKPKKKTTPKPQEEKQELKKEPKKKWWYGSSTAQVVQKDELFDAIIMEAHQIYNGTPVRIVLQQYIPQFKLKPGTTLTGIAQLGGTERISIHITGVEGSKRQDINFVCIDPIGMKEGIFSPELAKQLAEAAKEGLSDELMDLDFAGRKLAQKAINMARMTSATAQLEAGKKIFLKIITKEENPAEKS